jgi:hypothetical protein
LRIRIPDMVPFFNPWIRERFFPDPRFPIPDPQAIFLRA